MDFEEFIPEIFIRRLAEAAEENKVTMTLVLTSKVIDSLHDLNSAMIEISDWGVILLVPEELVYDYYQQ